MGDVVAAEAGFEQIEARGAGAEGAVQSGFGAEGEVVYMLGAAFQGVSDAAEDGGSRWRRCTATENYRVECMGGGESGNRRLAEGQAVHD
jgi:hypothetical protein